MMTKTTTRRAVLGGAALLAASPVLAGLRIGDSRIATLWQDAETAKARLGADMLALDAGVPAWMRAGGTASALGETRYQALTAMLKAKPANVHEFALIARATREPEIAHGPQGWAVAQLLETRTALAA